MRTYQEWLTTVPSEITADALWHMEVYRIALFVGEIAWSDICKLSQEPRMLKLSDQLYSATGSISANIAEKTAEEIASYEPYSLESLLEGVPFSA